MRLFCEKSLALRLCIAKLRFMKKIINRIFRVVKKWGLAFIAGLVFAVLCFVGINAAMEPVSKSEYCGTNCHEMNTAYQSWKLSVHGANSKGLRTECSACHLPVSKEKYFTYIAAKAYEGGKDVYKHYFGDEYDVEKVRERVLEHMSNKRCLSCHVDLLGKPGSEIAKEIHTDVLNPSDTPQRCVECHEEVGHQR